MSHEQTTDLDTYAAELDERREILIKAHVVDAERLPLAQAHRSIDDDERGFGEFGAVPPPFDPETLCSIFENSNALRPNVDAYCSNIDSHGQRFEPVIDFDAEDADEHIHRALYMERLWKQQQGTLPRNVSLVPSAEDIARAKVALNEQAQMEKARLDIWAEYCCFDSSLITVRKRTRADLEVHGNGYWEILRNDDGDPFIVHIPGFTVRLLPLHPEVVRTDMRSKISPISFRTIHRPRRFRQYVQVIDGLQAVFFKEFGDPRTVSRKTGQVFASEKEMLAADSTDQPATEILHWKIHSPRSAYGIPRWAGVMLEVLGNRQASEVNFLYFENKSIPPMALLVSGGRLSKSSIPRIEDYIANHLRGRKNFHKILILEAESSKRAGDPTHSGKVTLEFVPLTGAQLTDALFQNYMSDNQDRIGAAFRNPRIVRGEMKDFNRSTALAALHFAEQQVFQPEREEFDFVMNRKLLDSMGIRFWRFCSNAPVTRDPEIMAGIVEKLVKAGVLTPAEGRHLAGDVFNTEFKRLRAPWVNQPLSLTLAGFPAPATAQKDDLSVNDLAEQGGLLVPSQEIYEDTYQDPRDDDDRHRARFQRLKELDREHVAVPDHEFAAWLAS